jgi:hypothetical protein
MSSNETKIRVQGIKSQKSNSLDPEQIALIEEALSTVGDYGEVRLIVEKGRIRFLVTQKSLDVLKWRLEDRI